MDCSMPCFPVHHQLLELDQTHVHPTISSSVIPFSSCLQSFPASGSFPMSQFFASGGPSIGVSASASVLPMNTKDWSPLGRTGWISLQSKGLARVFSSTTVQKHQFFGGNDAEAETPVFWPPHVKSWLIGKDPDAGRDLGEEEKGTTEDEMAGWHHQLDGHEIEWTPGVGDRQGGLACCSSWGCKESDRTDWLSWTELKVHRGKY